MSDLIEECRPTSLEKWEEWYLARYPDAIAEATDLIKQKLHQFQSALGELDDDTIVQRLHDLIIVKTYQGLRLQPSILRMVARSVGKQWTAASRDEEAKGIDGYIGATPVSIKPPSYEAKPDLTDTLPSCIIIYEKRGGSVRITFNETLLA